MKEEEEEEEEEELCLVLCIILIMEKVLSNKEGKVDKGGGIKSQTP